MDHVRVTIVEKVCVHLHVRVTILFNNPDDPWPNPDDLDPIQTISTQSRDRLDYTLSSAGLYRSLSW